MYPTKNTLPEVTREAMITLLNARLADAVNLATQTKQAHWNVKGPGFIALHELFDQIHAEVDAHADTIAERLVSLGGSAQGTARAVSQASVLSDYPLNASAGTEHIDALATRLSEFGHVLRKAIDEAAEAGDADTSDLFTEVSRAIDKSLWFVEAHAEGQS